MGKILGCDGFIADIYKIWADDVVTHLLKL